MWNSEILSPLLRIIVFAIASYMMFRYNVILVITEIWRKRDVDWEADVHYYWRGIDFRIHNLRFNKELRIDEAQDLADWINSWVQYDPKRPSKKVAYLHGEGAHRHIHLQIHPNTIIIAFPIAA